MRKSIKSFIALFTLILGVFLTSTMTFAKTNIPSATSDFYVNDFAGIFSADEKTRLMDNAVTLSDEHDGIQVVVTTIESLDGDAVENYALEMYNQYGIGKDDMGLLILLSTGDRQIRVEVGKAMESYINDSKAGRFIDNYAIPSLKENKFNEGLINLQEALISEITTAIENQTTSDISSTSKTSFDFLSILGALLAICIVVGIIDLIVILVSKIIAKSREKQQTIDNLTKQLEKSKQDAIQIRANANKDIDVLQRQIDNLSKDKIQLSSNYQSLESRYTTLEDRYERVQSLYPTADKDVTDMIEEETRQRDMALAKEVDEVIQKVINLSASKDILSELVEARAYYSRLSQKQKSYVQSDINKLNYLYDESSRLKKEYDRIMEEERKKKSAAMAVASITAIISCISIGKAKNLKKLKEAKSIYDNLDLGARSYFDKSVSDKLDKLYKEAKRDKEEEEEAERRRKRREEEERRRRMQSSSSHSNFGSSSHYGGFGGHSGGGGASRGF